MVDINDVDDVDDITEMPPLSRNLHDLTPLHLSRANVDELTSIGGLAVKEWSVNNASNKFDHTDPFIFNDEEIPQVHGFACLAELHTWLLGRYARGECTVSSTSTITRITVTDMSVKLGIVLSDWKPKHIEILLKWLTKLIPMKYDLRSLLYGTQSRA
jgi:hypothetical protein